jgi:hypothetical protein
MRIMVPETNLTVAFSVDEHDIESRIYFLRGKKVMLDTDLARLYGVPTKRLNEQVKRNLGRFPDDFLFRLSKDEIADLQQQIEHRGFLIAESLEVMDTSPARSQNATLVTHPPHSHRGKNIKYAPYAFTEHGVTMLSAVLRSERAVLVSIAVIRTFIRLRQLLNTQTAVLAQLEELDQRVTYHDGQLTLLFDVVHGILAPDATPDEPRPTIGFTR